MGPQPGILSFQLDHTQGAGHFGDARQITMHEDTADDMTVYLFKHSMGLNLQSVSCHDGAKHLEQINVWLTARKRDELWKQAALFGKTRVLRRTDITLIQDEYSIDDKGGVTSPPADRGRQISLAQGVH